MFWTIGKRAAELQKKVGVRKSRRNEEEGRPSNFWIYRCSIRNVFENVFAVVPHSCSWQAQIVALVLGEGGGASTHG